MTRFRHGYILLLPCLLMLAFAGCKRSFYRKRADAAAYGLIEQKIDPEFWPVGRYTIDVDPHSRMFDPFDLDCPPMPPDDPSSHQLMNFVDGKHGYHGWGACGSTASLQGPNWRDTLPYVDGGTVELDANTAVELALLHSPVYQGNLENLYLSALDVSFERFQFDTLFFSGYSAFFSSTGRVRNGGASSSLLDLSTFTNQRGGSQVASKLFATGAQLVVGFANRLMWEFSGPDSHSAFTLVDFSLIQPLLRGGGRDIVLEDLTFSERTLLANVRQMERFRRQFYVEIMTGRSANDRPIRGGVALNVLNRITDTAGLAGGYLGLLRDAQDIRNQRSNIASLQSSVAQLEAIFLAGRIDLFQVELARQALYRAQSRLLTSERSLAAAKDRFKINLGLPPYLDLQLDDKLIQPFQLVDPDIIPLQNEVTRLQEQVGEAMNRLIAMAEGEDVSFDAPAVEPNMEAGDDDSVEETVVPVPRALTGRNVDQPGLDWGPEVEKELLQIQVALAEARGILEKAKNENLPKARDDNKALRASIEPRQSAADDLRQALTKRLKERKSLEGSGQVTETDIDGLLPFDARRLRQLPTILDATLADVVKQIGLSETELDRLDRILAQLLENGKDMAADELYRQMREKLFNTAPSELNNIAATVLSLILVQARARTESVMLPAIDMEWQEAVKIARGNRLDWMNARASLVDIWRNVHVTANDLESQFDLVIEGGIGNVGDNSFDLRPSNGQIRVGFQFDAPLIRVAERNSYRASQIAYQQARRAFYQFEDGVTASLRDILRRMRINEINFELNRAGIEVAISQVELSRFKLEEPPKPNEEAAFSPTTARDLVSALTDLLNVQNDFLNVWVSQEVLRRSLDLDLGTLQLDGAGLWVDPGESIGRRSRLPTVLPPGNEIQPQGWPDPSVPQFERIPPPEPIDASILVDPRAMGFFPTHIWGHFVPRRFLWEIPGEFPMESRLETPTNTHDSTYCRHIASASGQEQVRQHMGCV